MELKLLTPPTDVQGRPNPTSPPPSEASFAVNTSLLPRSLPTPFLDPNEVAVPYQAMARLGMQANESASKAAGILFENAARTADANATAEADTLYANTASALNDQIRTLSSTTTHETFQPAYVQTWNTLVGDAMDRASSPAVKAHLALKFQGLQVAKSEEVAGIKNAKYLDYQNATFQSNVSHEAQLAIDAATPAEAKYHTDVLHGTLMGAATAGAVRLTDILDTGQKALDRIKTERASNAAFLNPVGTLQSLAQGDTLGGLSQKEQVTVSQQAENRLRTLMSDEEGQAAREAKALKAVQDDRAVEWQQRILQNYAPGGEGKALSGQLANDARFLGPHFDRVLEFERLARDRYLKPDVVAPSDPAVLGHANYLLTTGRDDQLTQQELLDAYARHAAGSPGLNQADYFRLSGELFQRTKDRATQATKEETDADRLRKAQITDAEKIMDDFIHRGSRFQGDPVSIQTDIILRDAITELHQRVNADPTLDPINVANELIARRYASNEKLAAALPYKSVAEVVTAYQGNLIDKATATRYTAILQAIEKAHPPPVTPPTPPVAPSWWDRFKQYLAPANPNAIRAPVKP